MTDSSHAARVNAPGQAWCPMRSLLQGLMLVALVALGGCSAMQAQNPPSALKPVNAVAADGVDALMLGGHDVVAYFAEGRHRLGDSAWRSVYEGVTFHFASAEHKALFDAAPEQYLPQFNGYCTNGIVYGIPWGGNADTWLMHQGKLYIFGGQGSKDAFMLDIGSNLALANRYWSEEVAGQNSFWQRARRMVFRVPHYKSGGELAAMVAASQENRR